MEAAIQLHWQAVAPKALSFLLQDDQGEIAARWTVQFSAMNVSIGVGSLSPQFLASPTFGETLNPKT